MIVYRSGAFFRQFGETIADLSDDHRAGCESIRSECETLEAVGIAAERSGLFRYEGIRVESWWDGEDRYSAKLMTQYTGSQSAWVHVLDLSAQHASPEHWAAAEPEAAQAAVAVFAKAADDDARSPEWEMSASVRGAKSYY